MAFLMSYTAKFLSGLKSLHRDENGVTAIEYGLIAGSIAVVIIAILLTMGDSVKILFETIENALP